MYLTSIVSFKSNIASPDEALVFGKLFFFAAACLGCGRQRDWARRYSCGDMPACVEGPGVVLVAQWIFVAASPGYGRRARGNLHLAWAAGLKKSDMGLCI